MSIISFDFDDTLTQPHWKRDEEGLWIRETGPNQEMIQKMRGHAAKGHVIVIVTYRNKLHDSIEWIQQFMPSRLRIVDFVEEYDLPVSKVYYTDHDPKGPILRQIGAVLHYDDDPEAIFSAEQYGVDGILV